MDAYGFAWCAFGRAPDCEQVESELPLTVTLSQHWKDSSGPGLHRGGSGAVQQWMVHKVPQLLSLCMGNGSKVPLGQPLFGGYASAPIPGISVKKADVLQRMNAGDPQLTLDHRKIFEDRDVKGDWKFELIARTPDMYSEGDLLFGFSGGGPGYGDPLERSPELVLEDLKKNIISQWTAENIYQVVLDAEGRKIDTPATQERRASERRARLARGKRYDDFVSGWSAQAPPEQILEWYGSWPDAAPVRPIFRP
jgi:acetophenone carboxylase